MIEWILILALGQTIQERIDAVPQPGGGVVEIEGRHVLTKPLNLENKMNITLRGDRPDTTMLVFQLAEPGPGIWLKASMFCTIENLGIMPAYTDPGGARLPNVTATILACRNDSGQNGNQITLRNVVLRGAPSFCHLFVAANDVFRADRLLIRSAEDDTYGVYVCGDDIPRIKLPTGGPKRELFGPGGAPVVGYLGGKIGSYTRLDIAMTGNDSTAVHIEDQIGLRLIDVAIDNHAHYDPTVPPKGRAGVTIAGDVDLLTFENVHTESNNTRHALHVKCKPFPAFQGQVTPRMTMVGCRFQARSAITVARDAVFWPDPDWMQTNWLRSLDDLSRPVRHEK